MNSKNSRINKSHRLMLNLSNKVNLKKPHKYIPLPGLGIYYT